MLVLTVIFWILLLLAALGVFAPDTNPYFVRGRWVVVLLLIAILGYAALGNPAHR